MYKTSGTTKQVGVQNQLEYKSSDFGVHLPSLCQQQPSYACASQAACSPETGVAELEYPATGLPVFSHFHQRTR